MNTTAILVLLFLGFVMVGLFLVLWLGYQSIEEQRQAQAAENGADPLDRGGFLAPVAKGATAAAGHGSARDVLRHLESHVRSENRLVAAFDTCPTQEQLLSPPTPAIEGAIKDLEAYLHRESVAAAGFAAGPSVSGLFSAEPIAPVNRVFPSLSPHEPRSL